MESEPYEIKVELNGQTYYGHYRVKGEMVEVSSPYSRETARVGRGESPDFRAKSLLREMAAKGKA